MRNVRCLPVVALVVIGLHFASTLSYRLTSLTDATDKVLAKQRMGDIFGAASQHIAAGQTLAIGSDWKFRSWIRRNLSVTGESRQGRGKNANKDRTDRYSDPSKDPWGTPYAGQYVEGVMTIKSAGPDRSFGTVDDVVARADVAGI